jgi:hypothetical protein
MLMGTRINPKNSPEASILVKLAEACDFAAERNNLPFSVFLSKFRTKLCLSRPTNTIDNKALLFLRRVVNV